MDAMTKVFEEMYQAFVEWGGLDATQAVNEDFERTIRQSLYCKHQIQKQKCDYCSLKRPVPPGMGGYNPG